MKKVLLSILFAVFVSITFAQKPIQTHLDLKTWLPDQVMDLKAEADSYSSEQQQGQTYFIAAKMYKNSSTQVSVVVVDYRAKSKIVTDHLTEWEEGKTTESDVTKTIDILVGNTKAKEVVEKKKNSSQLYLYHADRYLITLSAPQDNGQLLKNMAANLQLSTLPE